MKSFKRWTFLLLIFFFILALVFVAWFNMYRFIIPNDELSSSESFYLQEHRNDLVDWKLWSEETLSYAKQVNKPLFLSFGFSTCYGCHRMQSESFRNPFVSKIINRYFVPILVDKNQLPLVNQIYSNLMMFQIGSTGWPMTIMATPDGIPLYLSTYLSKEDLLIHLNTILFDWRIQSDLAKVKSFEWLDWYSSSVKIQSKVPFIDPELSLEQYLSDYFDIQFSGLMGEQKFPNFLSWSQTLILSPRFSVYAKKTVDQILTSTLFDFVEGGVHRYSEAKDWNLPHYEKQFIDQVYFIKLLIQLYQITNDRLYYDIALFNMDFILSNYRNVSGQFMTGLDSGTLETIGHYYFFTDYFLDALSPLNYKRILITAYFNLVALVYPQDFYGVDRRPLKNKRKNSMIKLKKDEFVSVKNNAVFLKIINDMNLYELNENYALIFQSLSSFLLNQDVRQLQFLDLLISYDALSEINNGLDLSKYEEEVIRRIEKSFPFYKDIAYLPANIQQYDYMDLYNYEQPLFFILKYRQVFLPDYNDQMMCRDLQKVLVKPWFQLSLVKLYKKSCN